MQSFYLAGGDESGDAVSVRSGKSGPSVKTAGARGDSAPSVKSDKSGTVKSNPSAKGDAGGALEFGVKNYGVADKAEQVKKKKKCCKRRSKTAYE